MTLSGPTAPSRVMRSAMHRLPDEVLMAILRLAPMEDFPRLRLVDRRLSRLASDGSVQRPACAPHLLAPLNDIRALRGHRAPLSCEASDVVLQRAAALLRAKAPLASDAPTSWMHLVQQAHLVKEATQVQQWAHQARNSFAPSIWTGVMLTFAAVMGIGATLCDQGATRRSLLLVTSGVSCVALAMLFVCLSPLWWLSYTLMGLAAQEAVSFFDARLDGLLAGPCCHIDALLQPLA